MKFCLRSWLTGFALGFSGKPLPLSTGKTPIAYSYNGTVLPKLPEWDREMYPYAYLEHGENVSTLYCTKSAGVVAESYLTFPNGTEGIRCVLLLGKWGEFAVYSPSVMNADRVIWANVDVLNYTGGSVWLAASEPVPVYE